MGNEREENQGRGSNASRAGAIVTRVQEG